MLLITIAALTVSVGFLALKANHRKGYNPFLTGLAGSLLILAGKYLIDIQILYYCGLTILIAASLWNSWPTRRVSATVSNPYSKMEEEK